MGGLWGCPGIFRPGESRPFSFTWNYTGSGGFNPGVAPEHSSRDPEKSNQWIYQ